MWLLFLIILIILETFADVMAKEYSIKNKIYFAIASTILYVLANISWIISLKYKSSLSVGSNIFSVSTGIIAIIIGVGFYNEYISNTQMMGVILGVISLILLFY